MLIDILIGILLGYLAGLGIGGGTLLILWITFVEKMTQADARAINLMFFIVSAGVVTASRFKKGTLDLKKLLPAILAGCAAAAAGSFLSTKMDIQILRPMFGIILLICGIRELFYRPKEFK